MARPLRGGSGRSSKGGGVENGAPVAKRRAKRIEREFSWADQVAGLREFIRGVSRERVVLGGCGERESCSRGLWRESRSCLVERVLESRVVNRAAEESRVVETRVRTPSDASQRRVHVQTRAQCPTPEGLEERSRKGTTRLREVATSFLFIGFV